MRTWGDEVNLSEQVQFLRKMYGELRLATQDAPGGPDGFARQAMLIACNVLHEAAETIEERQGEMILEAKGKE